MEDVKKEKGEEDLGDFNQDQNLDEDIKRRVTHCTHEDVHTKKGITSQPRTSPHSKASQAQSSDSTKGSQHQEKTRIRTMETRN